MSAITSKERRAYLSLADRLFLPVRSLPHVPIDAHSGRHDSPADTPLLRPITSALANPTITPLDSVRVDGTMVDLRWYLVFKRMFDITTAVIAVITLSPLFFIIAILLAVETDVDQGAGGVAEQDAVALRRPVERHGRRLRGFSRDGRRDRDRRRAWDRHGEHIIEPLGALAVAIVDIDAVALPGHGGNRDPVAAWARRDCQRTTANHLSRCSVAHQPNRAVVQPPGSVGRAPPVDQRLGRGLRPRRGRDLGRLCWRLREGRRRPGGARVGRELAIAFVIGAAGQHEGSQRHRNPCNAAEPGAPAGTEGDMPLVRL